MTDPGYPYEGHASQVPPPPPPPRSSNSAVVVLLVVLIAAVTALVLVVLSTEDDEGDGARVAPPDSPASPEPSTSATPFEAGSLELPPSLVGRWEGTVTQQSSDSTYRVEMHLHLLDADNRVGEVEYPTLECSGHYELVEVTEDTVKLVERITEGSDNCVTDVEINLRWVDQGQLIYSFSFAGDPEDGHGTLARSD